MRIKKTILCAAISFIALASDKQSAIAMEKEDLAIDSTIVSKNYRSRNAKKPQVLVLHCVGLSDEWVFKNYVLPKTEGGLDASAHYYISQKGKIHQLVSEKESAFHAGVSEWRSLATKNELKGLNDISIGIEFQSLGYGQINGKEGYFPFSFQSFQPEQTNLGILLSQKIINDHRIEPRNIVWHSDITPRKTDPGPFFDGKEFAKKGVGVWPSSERFQDSQLGTSLADIQRNLINWGYPYVSQTGTFDDATKYALQAHCIHYLPKVIEWDTYKTKTEGTVFDAVTEWKEFPYDKDEIAISLENLNKSHFEFEVVKPKENKNL